MSDNVAQRGAALRELPDTKPQNPARPDQPRPVRASRHGSRGAEVHAIRAITERIRDRTYPPGQHISEARLIADLQLSRNTVREALRFLASSGMLRLEPNKGARVVRFDREGVAKIYQLREVVEGLAARLCALNINLPGNRNRIHELLEEIKAVSAMPPELAQDAFFDHNARFHEMIVAMSANDHVEGVTRQLHVPALRSKYFRMLDGEELRLSLEEHRQLLFAITDGDAVQAEALMRTHVLGTLQRLLRLTDETFEEIYA